METHLSFHQDAVEEFLAAFAIHEQLTDTAFDAIELRAAVNGIRSLALALEKGCKDSLSKIDPYLVISKPDRSLLLQLRKDMSARPVPSIFCSRQPFETINATQAWEALRDLFESKLAADAVSSFDQGFKRLVEVRNRAMHGEIFAEPAELLAVMSEVLARFATIMRVASPEWFRDLVKRNEQLESRLKGIEDKVDSSWQVLVDYLERFERIELPLGVFAWIDVGSRIVEALLGNTGTGNNILGKTQIATETATGLFASFLTKEQASARYDARRRPSHARSEQTGLLGALGGQLLAVEKPLVPLDAGTLRLPATSVWLALQLENLSPGRLFLNATLSELVIEFADGTQPIGKVRGRLECAAVNGTTTPKAIEVTGYVTLDSEWHNDADLGKSPPAPESTIWGLNLALKLTLEGSPSGDH